jgi:hypothetical protein
MILAVYVVNHNGNRTVSLHAETEDIVAVAQETGIPLRMLNDMVATWENADAHPVTAIERGLRWDNNIAYRVEVHPTREPDHEPRDAFHAVELVTHDG